jgi:hypothetical protein
MRVFLPDADQHSCFVCRGDEKFKLTPAEIRKATNLIGIALGMEDMDWLPDHISGSPFVIRFLKEGFLRLEREDSEETLRFRWEEGDELITTLHDALGMAVNIRTLNGPAGAVSHKYADSF